VRKNSSPTKSEKGSKKDKEKKEKDKDKLNASQSKIELDQIQAEGQDATNEEALNNSGFLGGMNVPQGQFGATGIREMDRTFANTLGGRMDRKRTCLLHKQPLRYFCDSCEELICYDCTVMGPHNTQLHRISSIEESFRYRFESVNKQIHTSLVPKRA